MADDATKAREHEVTSEQFRRNLDHILIGDKAGPEITVGDTVLKFRRKAPVRALAFLVSSDNRINGMTEYLKRALTKGQEEAFDALLDEIDVEGLGEILNALGEGYTSFPVQS